MKVLLAHVSRIFIILGLATYSVFLHSSCVGAVDSINEGKGLRQILCDYLVHNFRLANARTVNYNNTFLKKESRKTQGRHQQKEQYHYLTIPLFNPIQPIHEKTHGKNVVAIYLKSNSFICLKFSHLVCYTV